MTQVQLGRLGLVAAGLVVLTGAVLVPALGHIHEGHLAPSPGDGSLELMHVTVDGSGQLLAVGGTAHGDTVHGAILARTSGGAWRSLGTPEAGAVLSAIAVDGHTTAVVGESHAGATVWTRTGTGTGSWQVAYRGPLGLSFQAIAGRAGTFVAVANSPLVAPLVVRAEGSRLTTSTLPLPEGSSRGMVFSLVASSQGFLAAGDADTPKGIRPVVWRSTDSTSWTLEQLPVDDRPGAKRTNGSATAVAVGGTSTMVVGQFEAHPVAWLDTEGAWKLTSLPTDAAGTMVWALAAVPTGGFAADGTVTGIGDFQHGIAWTSPDGRQWHATVIPQASTGLRDVVVANGQVLLIGGHMSGHKETPFVIAAPMPTSP